MSSTEAMLAQLRSPHGPRRGVIRTLPGAGIRTALEEFIAETSAKGVVLILVPSQVLAEQWAIRLDRKGVAVQVLRSPSDALQLRSVGPDAGHRGVIVATFARARHGQARSALAIYRFALLLLDGVAGGPPQALQGNESIAAAREIALVTGTSPFEWDGAHTFFDVTKQDFDEATSHVVLTTIAYEDSLQDKVLNEARQFLLAFTEFDLGDTGSATGVSLHEMLLKVATGAISRSEPTSRERSRAWELADQIESVDETDGRLTALASLLSNRSNVGKWIIFVLRRADVYYLHDHLKAQRIDAAIITAEVPQQERREVLESGASVILATTALVTSLTQWPHGYDAVWWSPPLTRADYEKRMSLLATVDHVRVFQFRFA